MINLSILFIIIGSVSAQENWVVNTEYGDVRGFWSAQYQVWQFLGMPYATPPVGALRYKTPQAPTPWTGILNATDNSIICRQQTFFGTDLGEEDCLIINVYVPESARTSGPLPVLFFIHGGRWIFGNSNEYNPYWTTRHDVVLVTFNYRLGSFGYLCLGTDKAPGNAGLKDTLEALRWTNRNIANFGGDPNAVTLYGESAGAINVEALVLSGATNGLFHRAIIESGSGLVDWAFNHHRLGLAKAVALNMNFEYTDDLDQLGQFYETADAQHIGSVTAASTFYHGLCVERDIDGVESVIEDNFKHILETGTYQNVPIIFAYAKMEGISFASDFYEIQDNLEMNFADHLPVDLIFTTAEVKNEIAERVKNVLFGEGPITNDSLVGYINLVTDNTVFSGLYRSAVYHAKNSNNPIYMMEFSYKGGFSQPTSFPEIQIAAHADIVAHVMDLGHYNNDTIAEDQIVRDRLTEMWTNFVKYGDPTPEDSSLPVRWQPFTEDDQHYLSMDRELTMQQHPLPERSQLWVDIYDKYYYPPPRFTSRANGLTISFLALSVFALILLNNNM